ncbi:MAG: aldehyde dehydrogenase family protein, partial [Phycisphaerales bacterium]|nr:aldehyde dehydrogenase family protein [Phycisphaerales bacterium]
KTIRETRDIDIPLVARHFYYHAGWAELRDRSFPGYEAAGVCGQIIPWNFPLLMLAWKVAPALAAGCTVVMKSAEHTPLSAIAFAEICAEAGLPAGVFNLVNGAGETGAAIAGHDGIDKLAFTGSTDVGKKLAKLAAERGDGLRLTLELGGKSPNIIFDDASIDQAIEGIIQGIYFNQGHVCCAGSRLFVQEGIASDVVERLRIRMQSLRVGDPMDKNTDVGAINSKGQLQKIEDYLRIGEEEGAELFRANGGGGRALPDKGYFCAPSFFTGVQQSHRIAQEEIFGPVLAVQTFRTPEEALTR